MWGVVFDFFQAMILSFVLGGKGGIAPPLYSYCIPFWVCQQKSFYKAFIYSAALVAALAALTINR